MRRAGLLHDIGRVPMPTGLWDLPPTLGQHERDQVRFHAWETGRIVRSTPLFGSAALIPAAAHEHADRSGYHRGQVPTDIKTEATLLAAADVWCALRADRPYRPALQHEAARDVVAEVAHAGHLDRAAADVVLAAAQLKPLAAAVDRPVGLSEREMAVLRLVARGQSDKHIARVLGISLKTVAHHVQHLCDKIGVRSRAGAALFAVEHGLLRWLVDPCAPVGGPAI